jgi:hypothetical protein
MKVRMG